jgi:protocatechuate 3,4-dioxygenase beta subunit
MDRRKLLKKSVLGVGIFGASVASASNLLDACTETPAQTEGPFYPIRDQEDKNTDLVIVKGKTQAAKGKIIYIYGIVKNQYCQPVPNALVEIWQACASGKYNHPSDPNPAPLDPNFQYWGQATTDNQGKYSFRTIVPGEYKATSTWVRPPHIHFKVHLRGHEELTTQMYFKNHPLNKKDRILNSLSKTDQEKVLVDFKPHQGKVIGRFDIELKVL